MYIFLKKLHEMLHRRMYVIIHITCVCVFLCGVIFPKSPLFVEQGVVKTRYVTRAETDNETG